MITSENSLLSICINGNSITAVFRAIRGIHTSHRDGRLQKKSDKNLESDGSESERAGETGFCVGSHRHYSKFMFL